MNLNIKHMAIITIILMALLASSCTPKPAPMQALIVTGQNNHNWQKSSISLKYILDKSGLFQTGMEISPAKGEDMSEFVIDFSLYDVVVLDYMGDDWPAVTKQNFVDYVRNGGGVVVYHAANNAFPDWPEYNEIIGVGGWGGRNEKSGPYVYVVDGEVVRDNSPGRGGSHGQQHEFVVQAFKPNHPILKGLPERWMHAQDELYSELRGPAKNLEVLAYAYADKQYGGTGRNEPQLMTITYGQGRIFHTALGHAGSGNIHPALESVGFIITLQRGAEWAATGKVTQKPPKNFPSETESMRWPFFEDIEANFSDIVKRMQNYQTGMSNDAFIILKHLVAEHGNDPDQIAKYNNTIRRLLNSRRTTSACKRNLLIDFSWMADEQMKPVYEKLLRDPELSASAQFALDRLNN